MSLRFMFSLLFIAFLSGCASVPMESQERSAAVKKFAPPAAGNAGVYIYRATKFGNSVKKNLWIDGQCVGESAPKVFFYDEVKGNTEHTVSTESEFSPNDLTIKTNAGALYFIRQYIKMGVFIAGANLELVSENEGKKDISELELAKGGVCSKTR